MHLKVEALAVALVVLGMTPHFVPRAFADPGDRCTTSDDCDEGERCSKGECVEEDNM